MDVEQLAANGDGMETHTAHTLCTTVYWIEGEGVEMCWFVYYNTDKQQQQQQQKIEWICDVYNGTCAIELKVDISLPHIETIASVLMWVSMCYALVYLILLFFPCHLLFICKICSHTHITYV